MNYKLLLMRTKQLIKSGQPTSADDAYRILIIARMAVISAIESKLIIYDKVNMWDRALKKLDKSDGINVKRFNPYNKDAKEINDALYYLSYVVMNMLDIWQLLGGTISQLLNLCNVSTSEMIHNMIFDPDFTFSGFVFTNYPDYKECGGFIDTTPSAPLTFCSINYAKYKLLHDRYARNEARKAIDEMFPGLFDQSDNISTCNES